MLRPCLPLPLCATCLSLTLTLLAGCPGDDGGQTSDGSESESGTSGDGDPGDGDGDPGDGDGDPGDGDPGDGDGDPACAQVDCPCDPTAEQPCDAGLYCDDFTNTCTMPECGNDEIEPGEQCEDLNEVDGDGCDNDCTFTEILYVDASYQNTCVLIEGGRVRCWGFNGQGQLGYGHAENIGDNELPASAGDVMLPVAGAELTMGDSHSCILMADANVRCWGTGFGGRLGYADTENIGDNEFPIGIPDVMVGGAVLEVDAGGSHTCARLDNGKMRCWGSGGGGALGYGNPTTIGDDEHPVMAGDVPVGAAVVAQATGIGHTCAILASGSVRCWGSNFSGQLGYGHTMTIGSMNTPLQAGDASVTPVGVTGKATALALGLSISCALFEDGEVLCWGSGFSGAVGQGDNGSLGDNELPSTQPPIDLLGPAVAITTGDSHVCALFETGEALCWGANDSGQLGAPIPENIGDNELPSTIGPLQLGGVIKQIDAGGNHTCAIMQDTNELYCWGVNFDGQLGYGHTENIGDNEPLDFGGPVQVL